MDVPHYWTADQVSRLLDALASHNRHQARTAAFIMWRTGLRVSEVLELEWRDLDYSGEPATLLVRKSKTHKARTVRLHQDLVMLFTNWPANRSPRDKVVALAMRTALRHIGDGIEWASLDEESPGTGKRRAGAHSLRHSAARHWLMGWEGTAERCLAVARPCQRAGDAPDLPTHRGQRLRHGERAVGDLVSRKFRYSLRRASSCVQRESALWRGLMRLLTARVSGGTPRLRFPALAKVSIPWRRIFSAALMSAFISCSQLRHLNSS